MASTSTDVDKPYDERQTPRTLCDGSDTEERVSKTRELLIKRLKSDEEGHHVFSDLDIAIKTIEALLVMNDEIFERCKDLILNAHGEYAEDQMFKKHSFKEVKVWTYKSGMGEAFGCSDFRTQIVVFFGTEEKVFNLHPLFNLPAGLDIFQPKKEKTGFIDYKSFLQTSLMLHDDMLLPFLTQLKEHLEKIQVCLGNIDSWLMETTNNVSYLEDTFGIQLDVRGTSTPWPTWCRCGDHVASARCGTCNTSFSQHTIIGESSLRACPKPHYYQHFFCNKAYKVLSDYFAEGKFETTFDISKESDRAQLNLISTFLSNASKIALDRMRNDRSRGTSQTQQQAVDAIVSDAISNVSGNFDDSYFFMNLNR